MRKSSKSNERLHNASHTDPSYQFTLEKLKAACQTIRSESVAGNNCSLLSGELLQWLADPLNYKPQRASGHQAVGYGMTHYSPGILSTLLGNCKFSEKLQQGSFIKICEEHVVHHLDEDNNPDQIIEEKTQNPNITSQAIKNLNVQQAILNMQLGDNGRLPFGIIMQGNAIKTEGGTRNTGHMYVWCQFRDEENKIQVAYIDLQLMNRGKGLEKAIQIDTPHDTSDYSNIVHLIRFDRYIPSLQSGHLLPGNTIKTEHGAGGSSLSTSSASSSSSSSSSAASGAGGAALGGAGGSSLSSSSASSSSSSASSSSHAYRLTGNTHSPDQPPEETPTAKKQKKYTGGPALAGATSSSSSSCAGSSGINLALAWPQTLFGTNKCNDPHYFKKSEPRAASSAKRHALGGGAGGSSLSSSSASSSSAAPVAGGSIGSGPSSRRPPEITPKRSDCKLTDKEISDILKNHFPKRRWAEEGSTYICMNTEDLKKFKREYKGFIKEYKFANSLQYATNEDFKNIKIILEAVTHKEANYTSASRKGPSQPHWKGNHNVIRAFVTEWVIKKPQLFNRVPLLAYKDLGSIAKLINQTEGSIIPHIKKAVLESETCISELANILKTNYPTENYRTELLKTAKPHQDAGAAGGTSSGKRNASVGMPTVNDQQWSEALFGTKECKDPYYFENSEPRAASSAGGAACGAGAGGASSSSSSSSSPALAGAASHSFPWVSGSSSSSAASSGDSRGTSNGFTGNTRSPDQQPEATPTPKKQKASGAGSSLSSSSASSSSASSSSAASSSAQPSAGSSSSVFRKLRNDRQDRYNEERYAAAACSDSSGSNSSEEDEGRYSDGCGQLPDSDSDEDDNQPRLP